MFLLWHWCSCDLRLSLFLDELANFAPANELNVVLLQQRAKLVAGEEVKIALSPRSSPVWMIKSHSAHLGIIIGKMRDNLGDSGLNTIDCVGVKLTLAVRWNFSFNAYDPVYDDVVRS